MSPWRPVKRLALALVTTANPVLAAAQSAPQSAQPSPGAFILDRGAPSDVTTVLNSADGTITITQTPIESSLFVRNGRSWFLDNCILDISGISDPPAYKGNWDGLSNTGQPIDRKDMQDLRDAVSAFAHSQDAKSQADLTAIVATVLKKSDRCRVTFGA